jgi:hypothetical protein
MDPDNFKEVWKTQSSQTRLTIDADLLVKEVQRNERYFAATIFWRDVREVGVALVLVPIWILLGTWSSLPWTWYLTVPVMLWIAGFMLVDRLRHNQRVPESGEPLRRRVESSLAQLEHQIWLLRNVFWWYLLPIALAVLAFFSQVTWQQRSGGWLTAVALGLVVAIAVIVLAGVYRLNQYAVRSELEPRRRELESLLAGLGDERAEAG